MKKIFLSLLAILTLCTLARGANGKDASGNLPTEINSENNSDLCKEFTFTGYNPNATGEVFPIYDDCQTNVHLNIKSVMQSQNANWYETFFFEIPTVESDGLYNYVSVTGENRVWTTCNSSYNIPIFTAYPNATYLPPTGETVISVAKIDDYNVRIYVDYPDGNQDIAWNAYYPDGNATATAFHFGGEYCTYSIDKITFTETNIADIELPKVDCISTDQTTFNTTISSTEAFNNWMTGDIAILNDKQTVINLTLDNKPSWDLYTFMVTILDNAQIWRTVLGNNSVLETGTYTLTQSNSYAYYDLPGVYTISIARINSNILRIKINTPGGKTEKWDPAVSANVSATLPDSFILDIDYSPSGGSFVAQTFHMGVDHNSYTINSITFTDIDIDGDIEVEEPTDTTIKEDTDYTTEGEGGWEITTESFNSNLTGKIAILDNKQTNVYFTMTQVGLGGLQYDSFFLEMVEGGTYMSCRGDNALWGDASTTRYPNYNVDPAIGDYVASVAIVDGVYRVYVQTPDGIFEDFIWEGAFTDNSVSTFYMGGEQCAYTITKIDFTEIGVCNTAVSSTVYSGLINTDTNFNPSVSVYASYGWGSWNSGLYFPISEGKATTVTFTNIPFTRVPASATQDNGDNFIVETSEITDVADGITLRADNLGWTFGTQTDLKNASGSPDETKIPVIKGDNYSWSGWGTEENQFQYICSTYPDVSVTAVVTGKKTVEFQINWHDGDNIVAYEIYTVTYPNGVPEALDFHVGAQYGIINITSVSFEEIKPAVLSVINGNSSPTENPFVNCTKGELGTATVTLSYDYKAIEEEVTITVTGNYEGNENDIVGTITVAEPALTNGTIELSEEDILTALFGDTYGENPAVRLRDLTLLTFEGTFGSGITLTEYTTAYESDKTFDVGVDTTFGGEEENEWEIRTIGVTELEKSGEISLKDAYQTTIEYTLDKVGYSGAMLVEIKDQNYTVVLYGTGYFTETERYNPTVSSSVTSSLITPSTGSATFSMAKVGNNTIEATFTYGEESSVTFTIVYQDGYDAVESFHIGGSNCAYTVNAITFNVIENTLTVIDTENGVENQFAETVKDEEWSTVKIQLGYEYSQGTETPSIAVSANYTSNTGNSPLTGTITFGDDDPQFPSDGKEIEITQEMIFKALNIEDPNPSITLGDFTLLTLTGKNGLLLTDWHWTYTPTTNEYAKLDLIGNDATVFAGLSDTEIGTAAVALILTNVESTTVELTVTATYGDETTELTGTITIVDLVTASGIKTGSFTMADIEDALTTDDTPADFDWSKVTALTLSVGDGDYKNVQLRGATVTSYTISQNKNYSDGLVLGCQAFNDNLTGKIAILSGQQTNIVFEMTSVGTQDQDDTFSLTLSDMLCEGNNTISGGETAVRYPNYNIDPVVGEYTLSIANVDGTYRIYVATPESIEDFVWEGTLASDASTFTMGGTWCSYTISEITFTNIDVCETAIATMPEYATGLIDEATTFSPVINVYGSYGFNSDGSGVTFPVTEGYTTSVNVTMRPFTRVNATPTVSDNYVIETIATEEADGVTMLLGKVSTTSLVESSAVNTPTITYSPSWGNLSSDEIIAMCEAYTDLTIDASIVDEKTAEFVVTWNDDTDADTPAGEYTYTLTYSEGVPEELEFQIGADGAITTLTSVVFTEIIIEDENTDDDQKTDDDNQKTDDTTGGEDEGSTAIANVSVPVLEVARYNLLGQRIIAPQRGINIIVYSDGSTKKVLVK